jgi:hypothetical protein
VWLTAESQNGNIGNGDPSLTSPFMGGQTGFHKGKQFRNHRQSVEHHERPISHGGNAPALLVSAEECGHDNEVVPIRSQQYFCF